MTNKEVIDRAIEVFGSIRAATDWFNHMSATLGGKPVDILTQDGGPERVMAHLQGIERESVTNL